MKNILFFVFFICSFISCDKTDEKCCDCIETQGKSDVYSYPITPYSTEWKNLTGEEKYKACQIPNDALKEMCSIGLIDSWATYPLAANVFAFDYPQKGIDQIRIKFNGLEELFIRTDIGDKLFSKYKAYNPSGYNPNWSSVDKGMYSIKLYLLELTQSQHSSIKTLSPSKRKEIIIEALKKRISKETDKLYSPLADVSDVYLISRILLFENYIPFVNEVTADKNLEFFTNTCQYLIPIDSPDPKANLNKIINHANIFIQN